jgi:uncharacterized membrane protein
LTRLSVAKITFAIVGIAVFGAGIRLDNDWVRWAGIALVAVAWVLRFSGRRDQPPPETR